MVRIDRRRKLPATTLLFALHSQTTEEYLADCAAESRDPARERIFGMSKEEILNYFYQTVLFVRAPGGWKTPFEPERMRFGRRVQKERRFGKYSSP